VFYRGFLICIFNIKYHFVGIILALKIYVRSPNVVNLSSVPGSGKTVGITFDLLAPLKGERFTGEPFCEPRKKI
jgi:hypothetical protein